MSLWDDITGKSAAKKAAREQRRGAEAAAAAQQAALDQQMQMFREQQAMLQPFMNQAEDSMGRMGVLAGTQGAEAQQAAVNQIQNNPLFQAQLSQQEGALLQNAAATGGLRGGNTQGALAQFRPGMLQNEINQQFNRLGGIAGMGMEAVGMASGGYGNIMGAQGQAGTNIANIQNQLGQQNASNQLAQYQMGRDMFFDFAGLGVEIGDLFI